MTHLSTLSKSYSKATEQVSKTIITFMISQIVALL